MRLQPEAAIGAGSSLDAPACGGDALAEPVEAAAPGVRDAPDSVIDDRDREFAVGC
jgi:hypothetical protein